MMNKTCYCELLLLLLYCATTVEMGGTRSA